MGERFIAEDATKLVDFDQVPNILEEHGNKNES